MKRVAAAPEAEGLAIRHKTAGKELWEVYEDRAGDRGGASVATTDQRRGQAHVRVVAVDEA